MLSSVRKASKTQCRTSCSDVQRPHPARLLASSARLDIWHKPERREIQVRGGNSETQEVTKNLQLIVNSVAVGSRGLHVTTSTKTVKAQRSIEKS